MKKVIYFVAIMVSLLFTSCEKETASDTVAFDAAKEPKKTLVKFEDTNQMQVEGLLIKQGDYVSFEKLKELAPNYWKNEIEPVVIRRSQRDISLDTINSWGVATQMSANCSCGAEFCPTLGQELQGQKSSGWVQVASRNSGTPFGQMLYGKDPKPLQNYGEYHHFRHWNYNSKGTLTFAWWAIDPILGGGIYYVDVDSGIPVGDNNVVTWFDGYHEDHIFTTMGPDENAITNVSSSCSSCDACP